MNEYSDRQRRRDAQYAEAWKQLTPEQREEYARLGIKGPELPRYETHKRLPDISELHDAADEGNCAELFHAEEQRTSSLQTGKQAHNGADALASFCARIRGSANPLMQFDAACFATGLGELEGKTETELAERHGVTRAAFSKAVVNWCDTFNLRPSSGMKSKEARTQYRNVQLTRKQKV